VFEEYDPALDVGIDPHVAAALPPGDIALPVRSAAPSVELPPPVIDAPLATMSRVRRQRHGRWGWVVAACLVLAVGAASFIAWWRQAATLEGELTAHVVNDPVLPPRVVPKSELELPRAEVRDVLSRLEHNPVPLISSQGLATVHFQASDEGLLISVSPGSATVMYRVEIGQDAKLANYLRDHEAEYDRLRREAVSRSVSRLFQTLQRVFAKEASPQELGQFRDSVGLAASVKGFGYFVHAVHQRRVYPCVFQDDEALYFLLPPGVKRFRIEGRALKNAPTFFPGRYDVRIP
jgi:hypothetical protein